MDPVRPERIEIKGWNRRTAEQLPAVVWTTDGELRVTSVWGGGLAVVGRSPQELVGTTVPDQIQKLSLDPMLEDSQRRALRGEYVRTELTWKGRNYELRIGPLRDEAGRISGCVGAALDASERKSAEEAMRRLAQRLANAERVAGVGSWEWTAEDDRVTWSEELYRLHGLEPGQFGGTYQAFLERVHPDDRERVADEVQDALRSPRPFSFEHRTLWPDGTVRRLLVRGEVLRDRHGKLRLIGACYDVTAVRRAEKERRRSLSLLRAAIDATANGILVVDRHGKFATYNSVFAQMWRIPREVLDSGDDSRALEYVLSQLVDPEGFQRRVRELYRHPEADSFDVIEFKDGRIFERVSHPQRLGDEVVGRVWSFLDVTEHRRAVRARDEFLSVASHELRTPLATLQLTERALERDLAPLPVEPADVNRHLSSLKRQVRRLTKLVAEMLDVSRVQAGKVQLETCEVDLAALAREVVGRFEPDLQAGHYQVGFQGPAQLVGMWDRTSLEQVLSNLLSNAIRYGRGRPIEVRVEREGGLARLVVADQGIGIPPDRLALIFGRFERAVSPREYGGLGLGLYIAKSLVTRMGGNIHVSSEPGVGSTFVVELPLRPPRQPLAPEELHAPS